MNVAATSLASMKKACRAGGVKEIAPAPSLHRRTCMSDKPVDNPKKITLCDVSAFEKFKEILVAKFIPYKFNSYI